MNRCSSQSPASGERGFALLITITLLAFLVLLLVSLATLTRVETQVASNNQQLAQARQNALMALNIAVGQLQKYAGPDQRTTARADLENGEATPNSRWTGVYGSSVAADYSDKPSEIVSDLTDTSKINATTGSSARLLTWLVSGNEDATFNPQTDVYYDFTSNHAPGQLASWPTTANIVYHPSQAVSNLSASTTATASNITIDAKPAQLLVGPGTVTSSTSSGVAIDYVAAPLRNVEVPENQLPGFSTTSTTPKTVGRYAWWVGDEGIKARANLPLVGNNPALSGAENLQQKRNAFQNAPRTAVELMAKDTTELPSASLTANRVDTAYDPSLKVQDALAVSQLPLSSTQSTALNQALKYRYHDITTTSFSVLSDTYAGGLKKDLTRILLDPSPPSLVGIGNSDPLWVAEGANSFLIPTWGHLRSFAQTTSSGGKISPRLPIYNQGGVDQVGISPVLSYVGLGLRYAAASTPAPGVSIHLNVYPIVVLWNPYDRTLTGQSYEVGLASRGQAARFQLQFKTFDAPDPANDVWVAKETRDLRYGTKIITSPSQTTSGPLEYLRFRVDCPDLQPGESLIFTLGNSASGNAYNAGQNVLTRGVNPTNYVFLSGSTFAAGEESLPFRFASGSKNIGGHPGGNLGGGGGSEVCAYLGASPGLTPAGTNGWWDPALNNWYQAIHRVGYDTINVPDSTYQEGDVLFPANPIEEPAFKWFITCTFSSTGNDRTANNGTVPWVRWIAQSNIRAPYIFRTRRDPNYPGPYISQVGVSAAMWPTWFIRNSTDDFASSGLSHDLDPLTNQTVNATLFEFRDIGQPLLSLGQLQHANLSLASAYPTYPIGNSLADFRLRNTAWIENSSGIVGAPEMANKQTNYYDISWLLNRTLFDRYFFSTVPSSGAVPTALDNPRLVRHETPADSALQDVQTAAAHLLLAGGFNINSTSEQAWRAVLGGVNKLAYNPQTQNDGPDLAVAYSRFSKPSAGTIVPSQGGNPATPKEGTNLAELWRGYRMLSADEIAQLARNIVAEVRARGPFVSLAEFVNRRVVDSTPFTDTTAPYETLTSLSANQQRQYLSGMKGAIQSAIDATPRTASGAFAANDAGPTSYWFKAHTANSLSYGTQDYYSLPLSRGNVVKSENDNTTPYKAAHRRLAAFAPKFITQADILTSIGSGLTARSDTFLVRTYGEALNPVTGDSLGRAWCEAVVQRLPEYIDQSDPALLGGGNIGNATALADVDNTNRHFGRKFQIISFRWLSSNDI